MVWSRGTLNGERSFVFNVFVLVLLREHPAEASLVTDAEIPRHLEPEIAAPGILEGLCGAEVVDAFNVTVPHNQHPQLRRYYHSFFLTVSANIQQNAILSQSHPPFFRLLMDLLIEYGFGGAVVLRVLEFGDDIPVRSPLRLEEVLHVEGPHLVLGSRNDHIFPVFLRHWTSASLLVLPRLFFLVPALDAGEQCSGSSEHVP